MNARGWRSLCGGLLAGALLAGCASSPENAAPGSTSRTLSAAEVNALLAGEGMGMAAPAEINGYPGPAHVLELKEELELTPDQRFATSRLVGLMRGQARALGQRIVDAERRLDADLAEGNITGAQVRARLETIAALRAQLRYVHIDAHLEQKKILKPEQIARYYELRGRVVVREPMLPPKPAEPLTLPVEAPAATPVQDASPATPAAAPGVTAGSALLPALPNGPEATPASVEEPESLPPVAQEPAREPLAYPLTPIEENPAPPALLDEPVEEAATEEEMPVGDAPVISPGAQDAMEDAEPAREPPAYPLTPIEENPAPPALLPDDAPVEAAAPEVEAVEDVPVISPGAQDAIEDAEPAREPPAYPLTPVAAPPALLPVEEAQRTPERETPAEQRTLSPGMQDAIEFAEPDSTRAQEPVHIAPLEDELPELEPTDLREPVMIDLDN